MSLTPDELREKSQRAGTMGHYPFLSPGEVHALADELGRLQKLVEAADRIVEARNGFDMNLNTNTAINFYASLRDGEKGPVE